MSATGVAALQLRVSGAAFADISRVLGLASPKAAVRLVTQELGEQNDADTDSLTRLRGEQSARLEALMEAVWPKAMDGEHKDHLPAIRTAVAIIDRHSKLHGLDAPAEVVIHTPTAAELDQWVATMVAHTIPELEEQDVLPDDAIETTSTVMGDNG